MAFWGQGRTLDSTQSLELQWRGSQLTPGNTQYAALLAVLSANVVLFSYVYVAFREEKAASIEEKKTKSQ